VSASEMCIVKLREGGGSVLQDLNRFQPSTYRVYATLLFAAGLDLERVTIEFLVTPVSESLV